MTHNVARRRADTRRRVPLYTKSLIRLQDSCLGVWNGPSFNDLHAEETRRPIERRGNKATDVLRSALVEFAYRGDARSSVVTGLVPVTTLRAGKAVPF